VDSLHKSWDNTIVQQQYTPAQPPPDEEVRLQALLALEALDTAPDAELDALVQAASLVCEMPISLISLVDSDRQWFKARTGLEATQTPRDVSFCGHAILHDKLFEVPDTLLDPRFCANPLVLDAPQIRFYAGVPLRLESGAQVGTLCVIDRVPRDLNSMQRQVLNKLALAAVGILEQKAKVRQIAMWRDLVQAAKADEAKYETLVGAMAEGMVVQQADGKIITCNASAERLLGLTYGQMVGLHSIDPVWRCVHEDMRPWPGDTHPTMVALATGRDVLNAVMGVFKSDGSLNWISINAKPVFIDGSQKPASVICTFADVTERRRHEEEARRSSRLLRGAIEAIDEAFVLFDPQDRLLLCNDKHRQIYGLSADLLVAGASFESITRIGAQRGQYVEAIGNIEEWLARRMAAHQSADSTLLQSMPDGQSVRIVERKMPDGHTVGFSFDITDLINATEVAQAASQLKSNFLATMSHEIRTPMNAILGMLSLLQTSDLTTRQRDYVDKSKGAATSLLGLLNDILDFSKAEANKLELEALSFRMEDVLRNLAVVLSANAKGKDIEVLYDLDAELPEMLIGDSLRLQQVLTNLCGNAVKFTSHGQVILAIRQVHHDAQSVRVEFQIKDSGIGIAAEHQGMIFDSFSQAEASTTRRFGGTGLGLAICQRLVALMGGEIKLASTPGVGSTFSFTLNFHLPQKTGLSGEPEEGITLTPRPVLVVDDNRLAGELTLTMVRSWGWRAEWVCSGADALEMVHLAKSEGMVDFPFPFIFMDWQMPGMDGWDVTRRLRALAAEWQVTAPAVIMVTAQGRETISSRPESEQNMLSGFLVKPVTASMLKEALTAASRGATGVRRVVSQRRSKRALVGMRVLLVDDNLINQQVADELLSAEGAIVSLASDGQLAVLAVASATPQFDIVLMDIQMPVLDGYGATRQIRESLGLHDLPIVAMTANAMASDRETCRAAGMNEHVGKPFDLANLVSVMVRLTGMTGEQVDCDTTCASPPEAHEPQSLPHIEGLDLSAALSRMANMRPLYVRAAQDFCELLQVLYADLSRELADADFKAIAMRLHTLKGNAGTLGAVELARLAAGLEKICKSDGGHAACAAEMPVLNACIQHTADLLAQAVRALSDDAQTTKTDKEAALHGEALLEVLRGISQMALADDFDVLQRFAEVRESLGNTPAGFVDALEMALQNLDLNAARELCDSLIASPTGPLAVNGRN
jgi:PAS domain S-box-containing protein